MGVWTVLSEYRKFMYDLRDFGISIDTLLSGSGDSEKMMIGIDGGGTKTEFVLFSESGRVLNRIVLGGSNPNTVGMENAINILQLGIDTLLRIKGKISGIFVGAAGLDSGNNTSKIKKMLKEKYPKVKIRCENDVFNVIACGKILTSVWLQSAEQE